MSINKYNPTTGELELLSGGSATLYAEAPIGSIIPYGGTTAMRCHYDKSGTFRQTFLVPLKAGTYRYSHSGIGTLSVYMNRRDFA